MRVRLGLFVMAGCGLVAAQVAAQGIVRPSPPCASQPVPTPAPLGGVPAAPCKEAAPPAAKDQVPMAPKDQGPVLDAQAFAQAPAAGGEAGGSFNPAMFGDLMSAGLARINVQTTTLVPATSTTVLVNPGVPTANIPPTFATVTTPSTISQSVLRVQVPILSSGSFKISDNESPRPTDRVFFTYNFFDNVNAGGANLGVHREVIGFEKTFLGGNASFGMRLPFLQATGGGGLTGFADNQVGDITIIGKYALLNDAERGTLVCGGLAVTAPTADHDVVLADGRPLRPVLLQPYGGWILDSGTLYAQGFHSVIVSTDSRDVTSLNNDVGIGYWLIRSPDSFFRGVVPTIEAHLFTPLDNRDPAGLISAAHVLTLTGGINIVLVNNTTLGVAIAAPVTGPRPNNLEAIASLNLRF